jgi:hypothetical protein
MLEIRRSVLYSRVNKEMIIPFDEYIEIAKLPYKVTKQMMLKIAYYAQNQASFEAASKLFKEEFRIEISGKQIERISEYVGKKVFEKDTKEAKEIFDNMHKSIPQIKEEDKKDITLYIMMDGAAVNTRVEDENGSTWREAKTVMVFTDKDIIKRKDGSKIIVKKNYSTYIGSVEEFKKYVLQVAVKAGYGKVKNVVIIADGATWIRVMCNEIFPDAVQILDLYHLKENIYGYAKYLYGDNEVEYTKWSETMIDKILKGNIKSALKMIPNKQGKLPTGIVNLKTYIENNIDKIRYKEYKEKGYYIGSGPIESANKTILQRRLKQAGMRWSVNGAQYILTLRTKVESNQWDEVEDLLCA